MNILDIFFPPCCIGCGWVGNHFCKTCLNLLQPTVVDICPYCYHPSPWGATHEWCRRRQGLDGAIAVFRYNPFIRLVIKKIKYARAWSILYELYGKTPNHWWRIDKYCLQIQSGDTTIKKLLFNSIPLHKRRVYERGFNQSDVLLTLSQKQFDCPQIQSLERIKYTAPQARQPSRAARITNITDAFKCVKAGEIRGNTIILVDDLFTSGSTAKECAKTLKLAGARCVYLVALAHGT